MCLSIFLTLIILFANNVQAKTYKWVDDQGKAHITDDESKVPEKYKEPKKKKIECQDLPKSIYECAPYQCRQTNFVSGIVDHSIEGLKMGKCLYKYIFVTRKDVMACKLSEEFRKEYALSIWDLYDKRPESVKMDLRNGLMNFFLGCKFYWAKNNDKTNCSIKKVANQDYEVFIKSGYKITGSGDAKSFRAEAIDPKTNQKLYIDHNATITGGKPKGKNVTLSQECVMTKNGKLAVPK
jgi:hypothetical protein